MRPLQARSVWRGTLVVALALLAVNALTFFAFTLPRLHRSRRIEELASSLRKNVEAERAEIERLRRRADAIQANARDAQTFLTQWMQPMPEALSTDLGAIEGAVQASRLRAERRSYAQAALKEVPLLRYAVRLPLTGQRRQVAMLLRQIETSPRFIVIDRIVMRDAKESGQSTVDVELSTYYRTEAPVKSAAPTRRGGSQRRGR